ncbi:hypothetical protein IMZ48_24845 [Candidatus Bathyarchaeota archaeon]|nr:hypothetical protein [Candidatus Bathyarchaeota archaeon]
MLTRMQLQTWDHHGTRGIHTMGRGEAPDPTNKVEAQSAMMISRDNMIT